jgi:hypothetical protein
MPAGKAIAMAAMPTAVLMGMGFTPTLAVADDQPAANSELADEYKDCVAALKDAEASPSASPTPSPSASESSTAAADGASDSQDSDGSEGSQDRTDPQGDSSSSDSGSDDGAAPAPSATSEPGKEPEPADSGAVSPVPSPSETDKNVLEAIGEGLTGVVDGVVDGLAGAGAEKTATPTPTPSAPASGSTGSGGGEEGAGKNDAPSAVEDTADEVADQAEDTVEDVEDTATEAAGAADEATASPTQSPSASETTDPDDCPAATDDEGGVDNKVPVAEDPWYLQASSLLLKGADYQGIVEVKTSSGVRKKVLKYVISEGTDIGDLHQLVKDERSGKTYHVQAGEGTTSTIRDGDTIMYTESISGKLFGLVPVTFSPDSPPPLNIPLIHFTDVEVTQAAQFGGTLHIPGMRVYTT